MTPEQIQILMLIFQGATGLGIGTLVVLGFRFGTWKGKIDEQLAQNSVDHKRLFESIEKVRTGPVQRRTGGNFVGSGG